MDFKYLIRLKHLITVSLLFILLYIGCNSSKTDTKGSSKFIDYQEVKITRVKFNFDQYFEIKEIKKGISISDLRIVGIGFQNSSNTLIFERVDPFESFLISDIDSDGFEEIYIITRSIGSGSYGKIIGIASQKGKSYKTVYIPEYDNSIDIVFNHLEGYMGHDSIYVKNNQLLREFPVYLQTDSNVNATCGRRQIVYNLISINNSYSLQVKSYSMLD